MTAEDACRIKAELVDLADYREHLKTRGTKAMLGSMNTLWAAFGPFSLQRQPVFALHSPPIEEVNRVFRMGHALILNFAVTPSQEYPANGFVYLCNDSTYSLEQLGQSARSHIRRALAEFEIRFMEPAEVKRLGAQSYCDTFVRTSRSGANAEKFEKGFHYVSPARRFLGALKNGKLAAFLTLDELDDWVSIGSFSANEFLPLRPNNGLIYRAVRDYLVEYKYRTVSYGLSSIQAESNADGLHRFKLKMGFEAHPIHRVVRVNPFVRFVVNQTSFRVLSSVMRVSPGNRYLKKLDGAFRMLLPGCEEGSQSV